MSSVLERQNQLVKEFEPLKSWEERYARIIELGKKMPSLSDEKKTEESKVKGCQSQVWLHAKLGNQGEVLLEGDSDAMLVKGLVAVVLKVYSGAKPDEILMTPPSFLKDLGFDSHLSPSRANGVYSMVRQIRYFAQAFAMLGKR